MKTTSQKPTDEPDAAGEAAGLDDCRHFLRAVQAGEVTAKLWAHGHYPGRKLPARVLPGLKSVGFWDAAHEQTWATDPHCNEGIEFTYVENGQCSLDLDGKRYTLKPGDMSVTRPWQPHRCGAPYVGATRLFWLILDVGVPKTNTAQRWRWPDWILLTRSDRQEFARQLHWQEHPMWHANADMQRCFARIAELVQADDYRHGIAKMALMVNELFLLVLEQMRQGSQVAIVDSLAGSTECIQAFWREIAEKRDLLFREWTLERMARHCGLGITQFVHVTKRLFNLAPSHYLRRCRLEYAAEQLLQHPEQRVIDVAMGCGFGSGQYFSHCFRKRFGCSPQMFRNTRNPESTE